MKRWNEEVPFNKVNLAPLKLLSTIKFEQETITMTIKSMRAIKKMRKANPPKLIFRPIFPNTKSNLAKQK